VTHKLLLADDSVTIQRVVELTFSGEDVQVVTVGDGEEAIARIPVEMPDIVLADIAMPKRSGYEVAAFVKGRSDLARIPVVLLAGAFEPVDEARAREVKSDGVLVKPFEPQQVISRVKDLIEASKAAPATTVERAEPVVPVPHPVPAVAAPEEARSPESGRASFSVEQGVRTPERATAKQDAGLDDYFDRLDEAFSRLGANQAVHDAAPSRTHDETEEQQVPTMEHVLATPVVEQPVHRPSAQRAAVSTAATLVESSEAPPRNLVADMFAALFAVEQGGSPAAPLQLAPPRHDSPGVTDELVDEVTRRVLERLTPEAASDLVAQIVSEVAERLIREEIARIKAAAATRL